MEPVETPPEAIARHLQTNERLRWWGQPDPRLRLTGADWFMIPFSMLWAGLPLLGFVLAVVDGAIAPAIFLGVFFVPAGQFLLWGRFLMKRWAKRQTFYAVTDRRALVVRRLRSSEAEIVPVEVRRRVHHGGRYANFNFASKGIGSRSMENTGLELFGNNGAMPTSFFDVADYDAVDHAIAGTKPRVEPATKAPRGPGKRPVRPVRPPTSGGGARPRKPTQDGGLHRRPR